MIASPFCTGGRGAGSEERLRLALRSRLVIVECPFLVSDERGRNNLRQLLG
jgi:hypothetical protein